MSNADRCRRYQERRREHVNMISDRVDMMASKLNALADHVNTLSDKFQQLIDHVNMAWSPNGPPLKKSCTKEITPPLNPPEDLVPDGTRQSARQITEWMVEIWKEVFGEALSTPNRHNENRIRTARARFVGDFRSDIDEWRKYLERIHRCPWLMGSKGWRADFDWVLKPANLTKVMEGRYDDHAVNGAVAEQLSFHRAPSGPPPTLEGWEVPMDRTH